MAPPRRTAGESGLGLAVSDLKDLPSIEDITKGIYAGAGMIVLGGLAVLALSWTAPSAVKGTGRVMKNAPGFISSTVMFPFKLVSSLYEGSMKVADNFRDGNNIIKDKKE